MESSSASALLARELENIEAAGRVAERETNASDPLMALEVRRERKTNTTSPREMSVSKGEWETNILERETAAVRRNGEQLTSAVQEWRQDKAAAEGHQPAGRGGA
jgi:hypothetical protein